jgi:orotidine-5'-phosphate decarboxylase
MNSLKITDPRIIVALDYPAAAPALELALQLDPKLCRLKVGKELYTAAGPQLLQQLMHRGYEIFLDLKFHDIPNTAAQACRAAGALGVWMVNLHALGGRRMMEAARDALSLASRPPKLIAVTVLTSMTEQDLAELGMPFSPAELVMRLAALAHDCGLDGVVCSAQEAAPLRQLLGNEFCLVTPGIRPADIDADDQSRIMTPRAALENGASYLVIGRPITRASDPLQALHQIIEQIGVTA